MSSADLTQWLTSLRRHADGESYTIEQAASLPHRNWGFTIYRTHYGPASQQAWETLLQSISLGAQETAESMTDSDPDEPEFRKLISLFRLDARSEQDTLSGLDMFQLRDVYNKNGAGGAPMNADHHGHYQLFLLADEEVLTDPGLEMVKCVEVGYVADRYVPRNAGRGETQRYFGWMKMGVETVPALWDELGSRNLDAIAPPTIGGMHLEMWEGE